MHVEDELSSSRYSAASSLWPYWFSRRLAWCPPNAHLLPALRASAARIVIKEFEFSPNRLRVAPGTVVTGVNKDTDPHTVTANGCAGFDTRRIAPGGSTRFTAPRIHGNYPYRCDFHQFMSGTLTVR
ncbi:cupredoxin domain-containing protein [Streptomyces sp. NPDC048409]|uniref:cupredoxin domain-containing protein n=1 Tax=Streptomyces sp. NPDC048409 TaxID=3154723 RepID=UPI0034128C9B